MDIFKKIHIIFQNFLRNVIIMISIYCVFKTTVIVNISCYKIVQLKLHRSLLSVKEMGGQKQPYEQPSLQHLTVTLKCNIFLPNFS